MKPWGMKMKLEPAMLTGWPPPSRVPAPEIASIAGIEVDRLPWMMPTMCSLKCPQDQLAAELFKLERHLQSCSNLRGNYRYDVNLAKLPVNSLHNILKSC